MKRGGWIALAVVGGLISVVVVVGLLVFGSYVSAKNQIVVKDNAVKAEWAQIDVVLQRRADLIPNLVQTVKGYATHEEKVFSDIANARSALLGAKDPAGKIAANGQLDSALGRLLVLQENYPNLKADQSFQNLQYELAGSENRIAVERRRYNQAVQDYNTYIQQFPNSYWASLAGYHTNDAYFQASESARTAPQVDFSK